MTIILFGSVLALLEALPADKARSTFIEWAQTP